MARVVRLHGGPWHGRIVQVQDDRDHFHIIEPVAVVRDLTEIDENTQPERVETREGMYSIVKGSPTDYEWDGWRSHD